MSLPQEQNPCSQWKKRSKQQSGTQSELFRGQLSGLEKPGQPGESRGTVGRDADQPGTDRSADVAAGSQHRVEPRSGERKLEETPDGFHVFGLDWSENGYVYYIDGKESWRVDGPVSHREEFILISTECRGYRYSDQPEENLKKAVLPDYFIVDYVRVYDEVKES